MAVTRSTFVDDSGETRFAGTIGTDPAATAGDVLTADGAGSTSWAAGGGSSPFTGWTGSMADPADVDSNGGELNLSGGTLEAGVVDVANSLVMADAANITLTGSAGIMGTGSIGLTGSGGNISTDGGNMSDHQVGAGWGDMQSGAGAGYGVEAASPGADKPSLILWDEGFNNEVFRFFGHTAPADAAIPSGVLGVYFDQTNGAAKLKFKGKSANGTVVVGEVDLT